MRTRLLAVVTSLVVLVVLGLGAPLALSVAGTEGQQLFLDRLTDTENFASTAQQAFSSDDFTTLGNELTRYEQVYGIQAFVIDTSERIKAHSPSPVDLGDSGIQQVIQ